MANFISLLRIFIAFFAILFLFIPTTWAGVSAIVLTIIAFAMDGLDGYIARKFNETSDLGSVLDIMGDRIVEMSYWIAFSTLGWLWVIFPLICVTRAFVTDSIRSVALSKGMTAFGEKSMQTTSWGKFICASKFMRISYAVAKVAAFVLLIGSLVPPYIETRRVIYFIGVIFAYIAIIFCVVRAVPVVLESGKLFEKKD